MRVSARGPRPKLLLTLAIVALASLTLAVSNAAAEKPTVTAPTFSEVEYTTATAKGSVDPADHETTYLFLYATEPDFSDAEAAGFGILTEGAGPTPVEAQLTALQPNTTYHLRLVAENSDGRREVDAASTFTTKPVAAPTVELAEPGAVTAITGTTATFTGHINPNAPEPAPTSAVVEAAFNVEFEFRCIPSCQSAEVQGHVLADNTSHPATVEATGLQPNTTYEVFLRAANAGNAVNGEKGITTAGPVSFTTPTAAPIVDSTSFSNITATEAILTAAVRPGGAPTTYHFEYVTQSHFEVEGFANPQLTAETPLTGSLNPNQTTCTKKGEEENGCVPDPLATQSIAGLTPATAYRFRLLATNERSPLGGSAGPTIAFQTFGLQGTSETCPNAGLRAQQVYALNLPDCRAYEQVSPVDKGFLDALGTPQITEASPDGSRLTYYSVSPFPGVPGGNGVVTELAQIGPSGWSSQGILPPGEVSGVLGLSEDLSVAIVESTEALAPGAIAGQSNYYLRDSATGSYRLLARNPLEVRVTFDDATPGGSRILFEDESSEVFGPAGEVLLNPSERTQLYLFSDGHLERVGVLPGEQPGDTPPPGGEAAGTGLGRDAYNQHTLAADGSRVIFTDLETEVIYARDLPSPTTTGLTYQISAGPAVYRGATPDGQHVFYTENGQLFRAAPGSLVGTVAVTEPGAEVLGVAGFSDDGSVTYFVAKKVLAANQNSTGQQATPGIPNLYEWREGDPSPTFVAGLAESRDEEDWSTNCFCTLATGTPAGGQKTARVTPDGSVAMFTSVNRLTSYDNQEYSEIYRFDAATGRLACVSCNPRNTAAHELAHLGTEQGVLSLSTRTAFVTHNLSADGSRVFFQTVEALLPTDTNGFSDVYEWERKGSGGSGGCATASPTFRPASGGCLSLISTGRSPDPAFFGDASASGDDVFFFTRQRLVSQDQDTNRDVYDARVGGGLASQMPPPPSPPCAGEETCRSALAPPPSEQASATSAFSGPGNSKTNRKRHHKRHHHHAKHPRRKHAPTAKHRGGN